MLGYNYIVHKKYADKSYKYNYNNTCKFGSSMDYIKRMSGYVTPEAHFNNDTHDIFVYKIIKSKWTCKQLDDIVQHTSKKHGEPYPKINSDGGIEHYEYNDNPENMCVYFDKIGVEYEYFKCDVNKLRKDMKRFTYKKLQIMEATQILEDLDCDDASQKMIDEIDGIFAADNEVHISQKTQKIFYTPRDYQIEIIEKANDHYLENDKGMLVLMCGVGKTLISLWITQKINANTIVIGVPNILLLEQWKNVVSVLFKNIPCFVISSGVAVKNIIKFLKNKKQCIIITTYSSSFKVHKAAHKLGFIFDMKINDEAHHLTTCDITITNTKTYIEMLNIKCNKQLSLTATLKNLNSIINDVNVVSNDNIEYFGEVIDRKGLLWSINKNIICDYVIQTIIMDEEQLEQKLSKFNIIEENDKRLFLSAIASLKSICDNNSHHLLIYLNNKDNSLKIIQYIKFLLDDKQFNIPELYYSEYHSEIQPKEQQKILNKFEKAKFGIMACVYCLGEGWDFPLLDCVVFAENMTSNIRIVQSALRASRKNEAEPNKITKIILPVLNKDNWLEDNNNSDLKKAKEIIYQMGLEDETICQKINVFKINNIKKTKQNKEKKEEIHKFGEYDDELTQKLKLKTTKRTEFNVTYTKAKKIIADKNIKSKETYYELCDKDIRLFKVPDEIFKKPFDWFDYLSIKKSDYYDLKTCKTKINEYLLKHPEIKKHYLDLACVCIKLCALDVLFPPNGLWVECYDIKDLQDIIIITNSKKKTRVIL